jgi:hypothetical protein
VPENQTQDVTQAESRISELQRLGFAPVDAWQLAEARASDGGLISLAQVRKALRSGCPHELAVRIWL